MVNDLGPEITTLCQQLKITELGVEPPALPPGAEMGTSIFELYLSVQEFVRYALIIIVVSNMNILSFKKLFHISAKLVFE